MKTVTVNGVPLTICDLLEWQDPETKAVHRGFVTPRGDPFLGYGYCVVSETHPILNLEELSSKLNVLKVGTLQRFHVLRTKVETTKEGA